MLAAGMIAAGCAPKARVETALPPISVHGNIQTFEIAPVLLAAERHYPGPATVRMGGIPNLFGEAPIPGYGTPGHADVATHAETQALRYSLKNPDLRIILTVSEGLYSIVARRSAGITTLADLKGKRIATIPPTSAGYFFGRMLRTVGLSEADVTFVPVTVLADMPRALAEGRADAIAIWEPYSADAVLAIGEDAIEFSGKGVYREVFGLNTTAANLADPEKRKRIVAFVRGVIAASKALRADPAEAQALVVEYGGWELAQVRRGWPYQTYPALLVPDLLDVLVEEEKWLAAQEKRPPRGPRRAGHADRRQRARGGAGRMNRRTLLLAGTAALLAGRASRAIAGAPDPEGEVAALEGKAAGIRAVREIKRLQHAWGQFAEAGQWAEMAGLVAGQATLSVPPRRGDGAQGDPRLAARDDGRRRQGPRAGPAQRPPLPHPRDHRRPRRPHRQGPLARSHDDRPLRHERRMGGRHPRERLCARGRPLEDRGAALSPPICRALCRRLAQCRGERAAGALSLHARRRGRARPGGHRAARAARHPGRSHRRARRRGRSARRGEHGAEPPGRLWLLCRPQALGRCRRPVRARRGARDG
ncbi:MAG: ABC transporter substrate-binding protein [Sphingomonas sp.]